MPAGVTVGKLLQSRPETLGLDLEILAGSGGLDRRILSPYVRKPASPSRGSTNTFARAACSCSATARCAISRA